jgi:hypothetical protein
VSGGPASPPKPTPPNSKLNLLCRREWLARREQRNHTLLHSIAADAGGGSGGGEKSEGEFQGMMPEAGGGGGGSIFNDTKILHKLGPTRPERLKQKMDGWVKQAAHQQQTIHTHTHTHTNTHTHTHTHTHLHTLTHTYTHIHTHRSPTIRRHWL